MSYQCWICPEIFPQQKLLKKHLTACPHSRLSVLCPWCVSGEKKFTRAHELKRHANNQHSEVQMPLDFFSEPNGFWLSPHPEDYLKLVKPTNKNDALACKARELITQWSVLVRSPTRSLQEWQRGWDLEGTSEPPRKRQAMLYSPSRPRTTAEEMTLMDLEYTNRSFLAWIVTLSGSWYEAQLATVMPPRYSSHLSRQLMALQGEDTRSRRPDGSLQAMELRGQVLQTTAEEVARCLGVPSEVLISVREWVTVSTRMETSTPRTSVIQCSMTTGPMEAHTFPLPPAIHRLPRPFPSNHMSPIMPATQVAITPTHTPRVSTSTCLPSPDPSTRAYVSEIGNLSTAIGGGESEIETNTLQCPANDEHDIMQLRKRATTLLKHGAMPLLPAARRDWNAITVRLPLKTGSLNWPPEGWKSLNPSQRLIASEYAAMTIEFQEKIPADTSKTYLLDRYNFLVLPGSSTFLIEKTEECSHETRVKNFQTLHRVATTGSGDHTLLSMLELAAVGRDKSLDYLIDVVEMARVPLRL